MSQPSTPNRDLISLILKFLSHLFKCIWIFFPPILFVLLSFVCFWTLGQGKDLMVAFAENEKARALFFIAIAFWTYVSWYSSRIIAYVVARKQGHPMQFRNTATAENAAETPGAYFQVPDSWLKRFPRLIGFSCVLLIELAVFQLNIKEYNTPGLSIGWAKVIFFTLFFCYLIFNNRMDALFENNISLAYKIFYILLTLMIAGIISLIFIGSSMMPFMLVMILFQVVFILYVHVRRMKVQGDDNIGKSYPPLIRKAGLRTLALLRVPLNEFAHFAWFNVISFAALIIYFVTVFSIRFSWTIGPFPFVILAFAVLAGLGNIITLISVRLNLNFHLIILLLAALIPPREMHYVRMHPLSNNLPDTIFRKRQTIGEYYTRWLNDSARAAAIEADSIYDVYFVMANGGASRSGYWTAAVLGTLDDTTRGGFSKHLFCLSGASGGSVGNATFFSLLHEKQQHPDNNLLLDTAARSYLKTDFLTYTLARMLGPDYLNFILHFDVLKDRAAALEEVVEAGKEKTQYNLKPDFSESFSTLVTQKDVTSPLPVLCINVTRMQDGNPGVVSNIIIDSATFNDRVDVLSLLPRGKDIDLSTATILGARFPYVSPAGRINKIYPASATVSKIRDSIVPNYFVDGGYFDNSGAGVVSEIIRAIQHVNKDSTGTSFARRAARLRFVVIHITNSPLGEASLKKVSPLTNDLAAPLLTLAGAFDMQTTVNDSRLVNLLKDIDSSRGVYYPISLYKSKAENPNNEPEEPYAMNWFISQHTLNRMNDRLHHQPALDSLIARLTKK
ncbi:MAG TPA: hypothetical protein VG847_14235 [Chitinophagaceae bacterium]|nr:hypothetical protein [Chitinophagaceae bacterium]